MAEKEFDPKAMDAAAEKAAKELDDIEPGAVEEVANWVKRNYLNAGYKRLGRVLVKRATLELE